MLGAGGIGINLRLIGVADGAAVEAVYQTFDEQGKDIAKEIKIFDVIPQLIVELCQRLQSVGPGLILQQTFTAIRQFFDEILWRYRIGPIGSEMHTVSLI